MSSQFFVLANFAPVKTAGAIVYGA
jgi:hypothetical protein